MATWVLEMTVTGPAASRCLTWLDEPPAPFLAASAGRGGVAGRGGLLHEDRQPRAGHLAVALDDDDVAGVDRLLLLVEIDELVGLDRHRLLRTGAREKRRAGVLGRRSGGRGGDERQRQGEGDGDCAPIGGHGAAPFKSPSAGAAAVSPAKVDRTWPMNVSSAPLSRASAESAWIVAPLLVTTVTG